MNSLQSMSPQPGGILARLKAFLPTVTWLGNWTIKGAVTNSNNSPILTCRSRLSDNRQSAVLSDNGNSLFVGVSVDPSGGLTLSPTNSGGSSLDSSGLILGSALTFQWSNSTGNAGTKDVSFYRIAPNVVGVGKGSNTVGGWLQNSGGRARLTADVTESAASLTNLTDLSITLIAGRKYTGRLVLFCNESAAADGLQLDFNGGAATMTSFRAMAGVPASGGAVVSGVNVSTALATALTFTTFTGECCVVVEFGLVCNAAGTFIPRFSQVVHNTGTATARANSSLFVEDSPN